MVTREEHLQWCKKRANEYLNKGDLQNAIASMISDLGKHPKTTPDPFLLGVLLNDLDFNSKESVSKFIEGFN